MMEGTLRGPDNTKESPIGKVEGRTAELKATASDVLEVATTIEGFLLGPTPAAASEKAEKNAPNGWLETHYEDLRDIIIKLQLALNMLRNVKGMVK